MDSEPEPTTNDPPASNRIAALRLVCCVTTILTLVPLVSGMSGMAADNALCWCCEWPYSPRLILCS
jgi:hypothetical protein